MTDTPENNAEDQAQQPLPPEYADLISEWQFGRVRLRKLAKRPELWWEFRVVCLMLAVVYAVPCYDWFHRCMLPGSVQTYAPWIIPLIFCWLWVARYRLVVPEVPYIRKAIKKERRRRSRKRQAGEKHLTVLSVLAGGEPIPDIRSVVPLGVAGALFVVAFWLRDPTLTYLSFVATVLGLIVYRHGWRFARASAVPLALLLMITPLPGPVLDAIHDRGQSLMLGFVEHSLTNLGRVATLPSEGNPLSIISRGQTYRMFADVVGLGISEGIITLCVAGLYLSLVRAHWALKAMTALASFVWTVVLITSRLFLLGLLGAYDRDIAVLLEAGSRIALPYLGVGGIWLIAWGLKCSKSHRWVSVSRKF